MTSTPTGKIGKQKKRKQHESLRRRILDLGLDVDSENNDPNKEVGKNVEASVTSTPSISNTHTSNSSIRYSTRLQTSAREEQTSMFYKSILTPSRVNRKVTGIDHPQVVYRTPHLKSVDRKEYSIRAGKKTPLIYRTQWEEDVRRIINRSWKICYLSELSDFQYKKKNLKSAYIRTLKMRILEAYPSHQLDVEISESSFLNQKVKETDVIFLKITSLVLGEEEVDNRITNVYEFMLVKTKERQSAHLKNSEWFPLMLYSGLEIIHNVVIRWLQNSFSCYVTPKGLSASAIIWLAAIWTDGKCSNKKHQKAQDREVVFQYHIRAVSGANIRSENKTRTGLLKISLQSRGLMSIWTKIRKRKDQMFKEEQVFRFHQCIDGFVEHMSLIPASLLHLSEIKTDCMVVSRVGKVRLTCDTAFHSMIKNLIEIHEQTHNFRYLENLGSFRADESIEED